MDPSSPFSSLSAPLARALTKRGFSELTAVQAAVSDPELRGHDLRICSRTGSGKTVALGIVVAEALTVESVARRPGKARPRALLVAPTRELAAQIGRELSWLYAERGLSVCVVTGGTSVGGERQALSGNPAVVVGTPGRLCDHVGSGAIELSAVEAVVLDEADQMLELGFREALETLLGGVGEGCRRHLVSATFPRGVEALASRYQHEPRLVQGSAPGEAHSDIAYVVHVVAAAERYAALVNVLLMAPDERTLVFVRTRADVTALSSRLARDGFRAAALSGEMAQADRTRTLEAFRAGTVTLLVCTDVASRGLDVPFVQRVIHGDLPDAPEALTHRSGRTGRAGNKGQSVLIVPAQRRAFAEMLLRGARVRARFCPAPAASEVRKAADERAFASLSALVQEGSSAHEELAQRLLAEIDPLALTQALLTRLGVEGPSAAREVSPVEPAQKRRPTDYARPERGPMRAGFGARSRFKTGERFGAKSGGERFGAKSGGERFGAKSGGERFGAKRARAR